MPAAAARMIERVDQARKDGDSVGGVVRAIARGVPAGWGEPVFDKLDADLAKAMMSIPAVKGVEIGSGLRRHTDDRQRRTTTCSSPRARRDPHADEPSGGIQGGISNGEAITLRVAFKPTATIMRPQQTVDRDGTRPCSSPRAATIRACCRARCRSSRR